MDGNWKALGEAIRIRREDLGLTQEQAAVAADISTATWRIIETAARTNVRKSALRAASRVLHWSDDSWELILQGRPPTQVIRVESEVFGRGHKSSEQSDLDALANRSGIDPNSFDDEEKAMLAGLFEGIRARRQDRD